MKQLKRANGDPSLILVVDDYNENLSVLGKILEKKGYDVSLANTGKEALRLLTEIQLNPDIVLLDIVMPDLSGLEVCTAIKQNKNLSHIPVIFLTGKTETDDILEGFHKGGVDYITKPFNSMELLARVHTHLELKFSREQLQLLNDSKDRSFSIISHDIKGSLSGMVVFLETIIENFEDFPQEKLQEDLTVIAKSSRNLFHVLENLLDWATAQRGLIEYNPSFINLHEIAQRSVDLFESKCISKKITIKNKISENLETFGDYDMLLTIFRNLISNAIKYSHPESEIKLEANSLEDHTETSITDQGVGISEKDLNNLFTLGKNVSREGTAYETGTGLGLLLCKDFIERNNGKMHIESELNKGTTFTLTIPKSAL